MRCNGAGLARFHEWKTNRPGPLIADVRPASSMLHDLATIESRFGVALPEKMQAALMNPHDPIHQCASLLTASDNPMLDVASVNADLRSINWKQWPEHFTAFATNECGDYFAFDTSQSPYRVYYVGPEDSAPEAIAACEDEGYIFDSFDAWYDRKLAARSVGRRDLGEPNDAHESPS